MEYYYRYTGTIGMSGGGCRNIVLDDINDFDKPPCALEVPSKGLREYLNNRGCTDAEERYLTQEWIYDRNLFLQAVLIPGDKPGVPAKVIACADPVQFSREIVIFGPAEWILDAEPKSMDRETYNAWIDFRIRYGLRPRNGVPA